MNLIQTLSLPALRNLREDYLAIMTYHIAKADQAKARIEEITREINKRTENLPSIEPQPSVDDKNITGPMK